MRGSGLVIPACLAVTSLQLGCPSATTPEGTSTTSGTSTSTSTTSTTSTSSTAESTSGIGDTTLASSDTSATSSTSGETTETTDPGETTTESGSDTGADLPDCAMFDEPKSCNAMPGCLWDDVVGQCDVDCTLIRDMADCVDQTGVCYWLDGACYHVAI